MQNAVILKPGREKPVRQRHPWVFSGAIAQLPSGVADGEIVPVLDAKGRWLAQGYLNRQSQIQVRLLSWNQAEQIDAAFWRRRLEAAHQLRQNTAELAQADCYRLVHGESDYLPGLTVDRYGAHLVLQAGTLGIDQRKQQLAEQLMEITGCAGVVERSDDPNRRKEGLPLTSGLLAGAAPPAKLIVSEPSLSGQPLRFQVDLLDGQKTGFYLDQRENRRRTAAYCAGKRVLNAFSYTGAFAVHALAAGATHVVNLDSSVEALELGEINLQLNHFDPDTDCTSIAGDVFEVLRDWRELGAPDLTALHPAASSAKSRFNSLFDVIILDPPKFAQSKSHVERALRGYKDINLLAMQLLAPGGALITFSCSGLVDAALFQKVIFGAAIDAGRDVQIIDFLHQASDHPVAATFPEGAYLKGLICRVL